MAFAWWPPRPMRWRPLATDGGASIWTTRSMAPMSMPSSSDEVDQRPQPAGFQEILDFDALRPRDRSVVRAHERLAREIVERAGEPLGEAPAVDEDERRPVCLNQLEQPRMNGRPDRRPRVADRRRPARDVVGPRQLRHVFAGDFDLP